MPLFEQIRPYLDSEVQAALVDNAGHSMFKALLKFTFPDASAKEVSNILSSCNSIRDFQTKIIYHAIKNILKRSSAGFTTSGFEDLKKDTSYLFISNHRDIVLDTSLINTALFEHDLVMSASAIGDNLVQDPVLKVLSRLNRSFLVQRKLSPREMLLSSKTLSLYIKKQLEETRSVWMAQREGRTKDGNDETQQGVLKMLAMGKEGLSNMQYLKKRRIRPVAISYELDPTDMLKIPELVAKEEKRKYVKSANEDFNSIMKGLLGNKRRIHIEVSTIEDHVFDEIESQNISENDKLKQLAKYIDRKIYKHYKLWPSKYVAYDMIHKTQKYQSKYTAEDKAKFEKRINEGIALENELALQKFLSMYANPVLNREQLLLTIDEC